jgi:hypothetical protein
MSVDGKTARGLPRILTDSAKKKKETGRKFWRIIIKQELPVGAMFGNGS